MVCMCVCVRVWYGMVCYTFYVIHFVGMLFYVILCYVIHLVVMFYVLLCYARLIYNQTSPKPFVIYVKFQGGLCIFNVTFAMLCYKFCFFMVCYVMLCYTVYVILLYVMLCYTFLLCFVMLMTHISIESMLNFKRGYGYF